MSNSKSEQASMALRFAVCAQRPELALRLTAASASDRFVPIGALRAPRVVCDEGECWPLLLLLLDER